jgi:S1-C subfamily serine protease
VRIQSVTDNIAEKLNINPPRGTLVACVDDSGPAKAGGLRPEAENRFTTKSAKSRLVLCNKANR